MLSKADSFEFAGLSVKNVNTWSLLFLQRLTEVFFVQEFFILEMLIIWCFGLFLTFFSIFEKGSKFLNSWLLAYKDDFLVVAGPGNATEDSIVVHLNQLVIYFQTIDETWISPSFDK